jgi:hypothetical protein
MITIFIISRFLGIVNWNILSFSFRPFVKCSKFSIIFRKIKTTNDMIKIRLCFTNIPNIYIYKIDFIKLIIYELGSDVWKLEAGVWGGGGVAPFKKG